MIKVIPLGVNGAFTKYYHNNYVFELGNRKLLIDAGTTLRYSLSEAGYKESDITDVIITHLHSDHVGGLEEFAQRCKWIYNHRPKLWVRKDMVESLKNIIRNGLCTDGLWCSDYFDLEVFEDGIKDYFFIAEYVITAINTDDLHCKGMKSIALDFHDPHDDKNVFFTSDIKQLESTDFKRYVNKFTKAIFQDCSFLDNPVHSSIEEILKFYTKSEQEKLYLMHYQDDVDIEELEKNFEVNLVERGEIYTL